MQIKPPYNQSYPKQMIEFVEKAEIAPSLLAICKHLGIRDTVYMHWLSEYEDFRAAHEEIEWIRKLKEDKLCTDVERKLYETAMGAEVQKTYVDPKGQIIEYTETVAPSVSAQTALLKKIRPEEWSDKQQVSHTVSVAHLIQLPENGH